MKTKKLKSRKRPKRIRRVVLGVGHPWFLGVDHTSMALSRTSTSTCADPVILKFKDLGAYNKIRLIAEVIE